MTQFVVRTNRKTDFVQQQDFLDLAFVGGVLLDVAGLSPKDDFMRANIAMRQLSQGKLEDAEDMDLVNSYRNYLYQDLKNCAIIKKSRLTPRFFYKQNLTDKSANFTHTF